MSEEWASGQNKRQDRKINGIVVYFIDYYRAGCVVAIDADIVLKP